MNNGWIKLYRKITVFSIRQPRTFESVDMVLVQGNTQE